MTNSLTKIEKLIWTDPDDLLPGDKELLDEDFHLLGKASALDQQLWVAEMEASMAAASQGNATGRTMADKQRRTGECELTTQQAKP